MTTCIPSIPKTIITKGEFREKTGLKIAWEKQVPEGVAGHSCGIFWLGGFKSHMQSTKPSALADFSRDFGYPFFRFDYSGHGLSEGVFREQTVSKWLQQALYAWSFLTEGPYVIVGSSLGGWLALLMAAHFLEHSKAGMTADLSRLKGLLLIAPAVDMTQALMWDKFSDTMKEELSRTGVCALSSQYGEEPYEISKALLEDGKQYLGKCRGLVLPCPVNILQGEKDPDVLPSYSLEIFENLTANPLLFTLIKGGDHRLSKPQHIQILCESVEALLKKKYDEKKSI